jgi:hypothetical protein
VEDGLDDGRVDRVAAQACDLAVEVHVARQEVVVRGHDGALVFDALTQQQHVGRRGALGGHARGAGLQEDARLLQVFQRVGLHLQQVARATADLRDQVLCGGHHHARPFTVRDLDDARPLHRLQRFADGRTAHAVDLHQFALGRQLVAGPDLAGLDAAHQPVQHLLVDLALLDGTFGRHRAGSRRGRDGGNGLVSPCHITTARRREPGRRSRRHPSGRP